MKLPLKEPVFAKYLYISPDNGVHGMIIADKGLIGSDYQKVENDVNLLFLYYELIQLI